MTKQVDEFKKLLESLGAEENYSPEPVKEDDQEAIAQMRKMAGMEAVTEDEVEESEDETLEEADIEESGVFKIRDKSRGYGVSDKTYKTREEAESAMTMKMASTGGDWEVFEESVNEGTEGCADCEWIADETDGDITTCDECSAEMNESPEDELAQLRKMAGMDSFQDVDQATLDAEDEMGHGFEDVPQDILDLEEASGSFAQPLYDLQDELGLEDNALVDALAHWMSGDDIHSFVEDFRQENDMNDY